MQDALLNGEHFVLKITGKHGLVFKTRHQDRDYLKQVAETLLEQKDSHFTDYEIHDSRHANDEMTAPEHLLHLEPDQTY
jgi:hypothetical protein